MNACSHCGSKSETITFTLEPGRGIARLCKACLESLRMKTMPPEDRLIEEIERKSALGEIQ